MDKKHEKKSLGFPISRREAIIGGSALSAGIVGKTVFDKITEKQKAEQLNGNSIVEFFGDHQAGIETPPPSFAHFLGFNFREDIKKDEVENMFKLLTDDATRLTKGIAPLADTEPELSLIPANLTITFGIGTSFFSKLNMDNMKPKWFKPLPKYKIDKLDDKWGQTDLIIQICSDDLLTNFHAKRMITKDVEYFANLFWSQDGFRRAHGSEPKNTTMRNLFGQVDGTVNPKLSTKEFQEQVWIDDNSWMQNGTSLVLRRIEQDFSGWDQLDLEVKESVIGRKISTGAPLTGIEEFDEPDFQAKDDLGFEKIHPLSHMRRARSDNPREKIFRRGYNYDATGKENPGLLFAAYQANIEEQYVPIQNKLAEKDLFNEWIIPIGSAVYLLLPGCKENGFIGEMLFKNVK